MMNIKTFVCNMFRENCFVVSDETRDCVIIDCGAFEKEERLDILQYIDSNKLVPKHLLCTHGHIDHNFGNALIYQHYGLQPQVAADDEFLMEKLKEQAYAFTYMNIKEPFPPVGKYLRASDIIEFGTHRFQILPTPGHTPGSVFFYCEEEHVAFSGDTLFQSSIGRTDFERGSYSDIMNSLRYIATLLPQQTDIYPGHGPKTTIATELRSNPYITTALQ